MKIIVVSDAHIGSPECNHKAFGRFLEWVETDSKCDVLVLLGDTFDLWQMKAKDIRDTHKDIVERLNRMSIEGKMRVRLVLGNHDAEYMKDPVLMSFVDPVTFVETRWCGLGVMMIHGHQFDSAIKLATDRMGDLLNCLARRIFGVSYKDFADKLSKINPSIRRLRSMALKRFSESGYRAVIVGHTHFPEHIPLGRHPEYVNAGDWKMHNTYVEIVDQKMTLRRFNG